MKKHTFSSKKKQVQYLERNEFCLDSNNGTGVNKAKANLKMSVMLVNGKVTTQIPKNKQKISFSSISLKFGALN